MCHIPRSVSDTLHATSHRFATPRHTQKRMRIPTDFDLEAIQRAYIRTVKREKMEK